MKHRGLGFGVVLIGVLAVIPALYIAVSGVRSPAEAKRLHQEAQALERAGKIDEAIATYRAALANDPEAIPINRDYQNLMRRAGKLEEVRAEYRKRAANMPKDAASQYLLARLEDGDALEKGMLRTLEIDPQFPWAHRALGARYAEAGRLDEAAASYRRAAASPGATPEDAGTLVAFLFKYDRLGDLDGVIKEWGERRPAFCPSEESVISLAIPARPDGMTLQLHVGVGANTELLYGVRISRPDSTFRQMSVRRAGNVHVLRWTREWLKPGQPDEAPESWERPDRPPFPEVYSDALRRLKENEK